MDYYRVTYTVKDVSGTQTFRVKAASEEEALALCDAGEGEFLNEDLCVMSSEAGEAELDDNQEEPKP